MSVEYAFNVLTALRLVILRDFYGNVAGFEVGVEKELIRLVVWPYEDCKSVVIIFQIKNTNMLH